MTSETVKITHFVPHSKNMICAECEGIQWFINRNSCQCDTCVSPFTLLLLIYIYIYIYIYICIYINRSRGKGDTCVTLTTFSIYKAFNAFKFCTEHILTMWNRMCDFHSLWCHGLPTLLSSRPNTILPVLTFGDI